MRRSKHVVEQVLKKRDTAIIQESTTLAETDSVKDAYRKRRLMFVQVRASTFTKFCKRLHEFQKSKRFRLHAITVLNFLIFADR